MCACALPLPAQGGRGGGGGGDAHAALAEDQQEDLAVAEIFAANQRMRYMPLIQSAIARDRAKCVCVSVRPRERACVRACVCECVRILAAGLPRPWPVRMPRVHAMPSRTIQARPQR